MSSDIRSSLPHRQTDPNFVSLLPEVRAAVPHDDGGDRFSRITGGILTAGAHAAIVLALLLLTWQTLPKTLFQPRPINWIAVTPKQPPAPPAIRPRFVAPQAVPIVLPQFDVAAPTPSDGMGADTVARSALPQKPVAAPSVISPPVSKDSVEDLDAYYKKIVAYLQARLHRPSQAGRQGQQLTATVHVISDRAGHVQLAELYWSSGYDDLDREAVDVVKRSDPLPPMPAGTKADKINVNIPVVFNFLQDINLGP